MTDTAETLRQLARAKAAFQLHTIKMVLAEKPVPHDDSKCPECGRKGEKC